MRSANLEKGFDRNIGQQQQQQPYQKQPETFNTLFSEEEKTKETVKTHFSTNTYIHHIQKTTLSSCHSKNFSLFTHLFL
jgi:hypothetical protein